MIYWFLLRYTVIIYKFTQGNLGAKKNRQLAILVASQEKKIANCDIGDWQRDSCMLEQLQATMRCELTIFFNFISKGMNRTENLCDMQQQVKERTARVTVSWETSTAIGTLEETVDEVQPTELESGGDFQFETVDELTFGNCDDSDFSDDEYSTKAGIYRAMCWEGLIEEWLLIKLLTI